MAQCKDCHENTDCEYRKHPSNSHITDKTYHNCLEFNGIIMGYRIHRIGGTYPEGHVTICKIQ